MRIQKALVEKGVVVLMFVLVLVVFSIAERETQKVLELHSAGDTAELATQPIKLMASSSEKMLEIGRKKIEKEELGTKIELMAGDGETINFPDNSFDGVMVAFGVRNFEHLEKGMKEILRVLKPGGQLVVLEFSKPRIPGVRSFYNLYMGFIAPQMARLFKQNKKAYQYLNESAKAFPDRQHFDTILKQSGYSETTWKPLSLGICCIYSGRKPKI